MDLGEFARNKLLLVVPIIALGLIGTARAESSTSVHLLRIARIPKSAPSETCDFQLMTDQLGTVLALKMSCQDGTSLPITLEQATSNGGVRLKEYRGRYKGIIPVRCDLTFLQLSADFHPSQGGHAEVRYQKNCKTKNQWGTVALNLTKVGSVWSVEGPTREPVNCLDIIPGELGISELKPGMREACAAPMLGNKLSSLTTP